MIFGVTLISLQFLVAMTIKFRNRPELVLWFLWIISGIFVVNNTLGPHDEIYCIEMDTFVLCEIAFVYIFKKFKADILVKISIPIYIFTIVLMLIVIICPSPNNPAVKNHIEFGPFSITLSNLLIFMLLPVAKIINSNRKSNRFLFVSITLIMVFELFLLSLQLDISSVIVFAFAFFMLLVRIKRDNYVNIPKFMTILFFVFFFFSLLIWLEISGKNEAIFDMLKTNDYEQLEVLFENNWEIIKSIKLFGRSNYQGILINNISTLNFLKIGIEYGWIPCISLCFTLTIFLLRLNKMAKKIKNLFLRYMYFGGVYYFISLSISGIICIFILPGANIDLPFWGSPQNNLVQAIYFAMMLAFYEQRKEVKIERRLDVDYIFYKESIKRFDEEYTRNISASKEQTDKDKWEKRLNNLRNQEKIAPTDMKLLNEIYTDYINSTSQTSKKDNTEIFISYSHKDGKYVDYLAKELESLGLKTWYYERDMVSKDGTNDYAIAIINAIKRAKIVVVVLSTSSVMSEHVKNEVCLAFGQIPNGTFIMPVMIENTDLDESLSYFLCRQNITSAITPPVKKQLKEFASKVKQALS